MFERYIETEEYLPLPFSGNRYYLNINGSIKEKNGESIASQKDAQGHVIVWLDWINGQKFYILSVLVAFTFKPVRLPLKYWELLNVEFKDENGLNLHPSNLVWRYPVGLGSEEHFGFSYIPMFSRYVINRDGVVYEKSWNKIVKPHFNKGYYSYSLKPDVGPRTSLKRHRGICLAFTSYPTNVDDMQVNHINGVAGDDRIDNLEWVTCSENRLHAISNGLTLVNKPVVARNTETGEEIEYNTLDSFCHAFNLSEPKVSKVLAKIDEPLIHSVFEISYKHKEHAILKNTNRRAVLVRDIRTGEVNEYESIVSCADKLGVTKHFVNWRINTPTGCLYNDYRQFKRKSDTTPWYTPVDYEKEILERSWSKITQVRDALSGEVTEHDTQRQAAQHLGISESTINLWLSHPRQPVFKTQKDGRFVQVKNKSDISNWRIPTDPVMEFNNRLQVKTVLVRDVKTNIVSEFSSAKKCADALGISPTNLNWRLKSKGQKVFSKQWQFKYKSDNVAFAEIQVSDIE